MSDYILRLYTLSIFILFLLTVGSSHTIFAKQHLSSKSDTQWGVRTTTIETEAGRLTVNMPDDASLGDTISGTVVAEPVGETSQERQANMDTLEGYVFDTPDVPSKVVEAEPEDTTTKRPGGKKVVTLEIPPAIATEIVDLVLKDPKGNEVTKVDVPVSPPTAYTPPAAPQESDYNLPKIGQAGRPIEMTGPFDGEIVNTGVTIGGKNAKVLAQSPRKTVVESPRDVVGPTDIELTQGGVTVKEQYRNIALNLSADKLKLKRGEQTTLRVQIIGLQGLKEEIPFTLQNKSPSVVTMEGGDSQTVTVGPDMVGSEGVYTITKTLTGIKPGPFSISARISPEYMTVPLLTMPGEVPVNADTCECKDMRVELGRKSETRRFQDKSNNGNTRIRVEIPYKYKTKCTKEELARCEAEIKVSAEWKGSEKEPKPLSEEVHNGEAPRVTYFSKPPKGAGDKNIDCSRDCPGNTSWGQWEAGTIHYEALFGQLETDFEEKVRIKLTPDKCDRGGEKFRTYDVSNCTCDKITILFPDLKFERRGEYSVKVDSGRITWRNPGVRLNIPYLLTTTCTGHWRAKCNAEVQVEGKAKKWTVEHIEIDGNRQQKRFEKINPANIAIKNTRSIECTGKCGKRGETTKWNPRDVRQISLRVDVPEGQIDKDDINSHIGEFELSFKPKYCDNIEIRDKAGKDGKAIDKITFKADIKED